MNMLKHRQKKIQEKRKKTPWRKFVMEIASRAPLVFHKHDRLISTIPATNRMKGVEIFDMFSKNRDSLLGKYQQQ